MQGGKARGWEPTRRLADDGKRFVEVNGVNEAELYVTFWVFGAPEAPLRGGPGEEGAGMELRSAVGG